MVNASTVRFTFNTSPVTAQGPQTMRMAAGSIRRSGDGEALQAWTGTFYYDTLPLRVASTTPDTGEVLYSVPTYITVQFNENVASGSVGVSDLVLDTGTVTAATLVSANTVRYTVSGLISEGTVRFSLGAGALTDAYGNPSAAYSGQFVITNPATTRYDSTNVPVTIVDLKAVRSIITVPDVFSIRDLDVYLNIAHTYISDLQVYVISPAGTRVLLFCGVGGFGDNFTHTILDDEASVSITSGSAPFTGRYRPQAALSAFDGQNAAGTWTLEITDRYTWDTGTLLGWAIIAEGRSTNGAPRAANDSYSLNEDAALSVAPAAGVLANDSDPDGDPLIATLVSAPIRGTVTLNANGSFTYTPSRDFNGTDSFTYRASDGRLTSSVGTVVLTVNPVNDAPTLTTISTLNGATEDRDFIITYEMLLAASDARDIDGDIITFRIASITSGALAKNGVTVAAGATMVGPGESLVWRPDRDTNGTLSAFAVEAWDGQVASQAAAQVTVDVEAVPDAEVFVTVRWNSSSGSHEVVRFNKVNGEVESIGTLADMKLWQGQSVFDAVGGKLYLAGLSASGVYRLYSVNTETGAVGAPITLSRTDLVFAGMDSDGKIVALAWNAANAVQDVLKINLATGAIQKIGTVGDMKCWQRQSTLDAAAHRLYVVGMPLSGPSKLYVIDTTSGTLIAQHTLDKSDLCLSGIDDHGYIVALRWNATDRVEEVYRINPTNGVVGSRVGVVAGLKGWFGKSTLDSGNNMLYVNGISEDGVRKLFAFDLERGAISSDFTLPAGCGDFISHYTEIATSSSRAAADLSPAANASPSRAPELGAVWQDLLAAMKAEAVARAMEPIQDIDVLTAATLPSQPKSGLVAGFPEDLDGSGTRTETVVRTSAAVKSGTSLARLAVADVGADLFTAIGEFGANAEFNPLGADVVEVESIFADPLLR